ncbi:MAG: hypothetical protein CSA33_04530 [Desulfobulbus propionicus]|nr:MAG: hypothetical protein CSA33_04530 [Desulfobulbus propionicus]
MLGLDIGAAKRLPKMGSDGLAFGGHLGKMRHNVHGKSELNLHTRFLPREPGAINLFFQTPCVVEHSPLAGYLSAGASQEKSMPAVFLLFFRVQTPYTAFSGLPE